MILLMLVIHCSSNGKLQFQKHLMENLQLFSSRIVLYHSTVLISLSKNVYSITQTEHITRLTQIAEKSFDKAEFFAQRTRGTYVAAVCRSDLTLWFSHASQIVIPDSAAAKKFNKWIAPTKESPSRVLKFVRIDNSSAEISVFADASFATNRDHTSQFGFVILLADKFYNTNVLHYTSMES